MTTLMFSPVKTWNSISESDHGWAYHFFFALVPTLAICCALEGWALKEFGAKTGFFGMITQFDHHSVLRFETAQAGLTIAMVIFGALLIRLVASSSHFSPPFGPCFLAALYGFGPIIYVKVLDGIPVLNTWICWSIGAGGIFYALYYGIPICLKLDQAKAFGVFFLSSIMLILLSAFTHWVILSVLHGNGS